MSFRYYLGNFTLFALVGAVFYVLAVALNWIALDLLGFDPLVAPFVIITLLFVLKYYCYLFARTIVPSFWRYTFSNLFLTVLSTYMISIIFSSGMAPGWLATAVVLAVFMLLRYAVLHAFRVIRRPDSAD